MDESEIIDLFCDINGLGEGLVPIEKFDIRTYTASWYRRKFPNFPPQFYELMEKASQEKIANFTMDGKKEGMIKINEEQTISFGGTSNEPGVASQLRRPSKMGRGSIFGSGPQCGYFLINKYLASSQLFSFLIYRSNFSKNILPAF